MIKKWTFHLNHQANVNNDIVKRHERFLETLRGLGKPWEIPINKASQANPVRPGELCEIIQLGSVLPGKMKGNIVYPVRIKPYIDDKDDHLNINFNLNNVDFKVFSTQIFKHYISSFDAYRAEIYFDAASAIDFPEIQKIFFDTGKNLNARDGIYRIGPLCYFSDELCKKSFGFTSREVVNRLKDDVEDVYEHHNGVIIIYSSEPVDKETYFKIDKELRPLLSKKKSFLGFRI